MDSKVIAPWAEVVPDRPPMTAEDLFRLPDDGWQYELVEGRLVRMAPEGGESSYLGIELAAEIRQIAREHRLGVVLGASGGFRLNPPSEPHTVLAPDVSFIRAERVPPRSSPEYAQFWRLAPDLAVEVASPGQTRPQLAAKVRLYLEAGVRLVWVVWPRRREVDVWHPGTDAPSTLRGADTLDGEDVVPGFRLPLASLFGGSN